MKSGLPPKPIDFEQLTPGGVTPSGEYEFGEYENQHFRALARVMKFVGVVTIAFGILGLLGVAIRVLGAGDGTSGYELLLSAVQSLLFVFIGAWTINAASHFRSVADTQGNDVQFLMRAVGDLRKIYTLQMWLFIIAFALAAIVLVVLLL